MAESAPKRIRTMKSTMPSYGPASLVTLRVGEGLEKKDFMVHESFITCRSEFFRRALNGNWEESDTHVINMPNDKPDIVALYINFVYSGHISTEEELRGPCFCDEFWVLFDIYILAEKLQDVGAKNAVLEVVLHMSEMGDKNEAPIIPNITTINNLYERTPPNSPARRLVVDLWGSYPFVTLYERFDSMHKEFRDDLVQLISKLYSPPAKNIAASNTMKAYLEMEVDGVQ